MASADSNIFETERKKLMVAAIDFGTTFSGWAYSFDFNPSKISCKQWCSGNSISMKAPTTVLIQADGNTLEAFGYEAEERYAELADEEKHRPYFYFQRFKMMLFDNKHLTRNENLADDSGKRLPAKRVFTMVIKYLKDDLMDDSRKRLTGIVREEEIQWVLTVPAIWTPPAKQFMRECAVEAGIRSQNLLIALEPEAASLYCKYHMIEKQDKENRRESEVVFSFKPGERYMVVDAGGGTVDIIVHEVCIDGTLKEIYKANGGNWGGTKVDKAFQDFITGIFGKDVMKRFHDEHKGDFLDLQREFELKKRFIKPDLKSKIKFKIPASLFDIYKNMNQESIMKNIENYEKLSGKLTFLTDKALFDCSLFKNLFTTTNNSIIQHLKGILEVELTANTNAILMVGGFSESPMLFEAVRSSFKDRNIILPEDAGLSVLRGAVIFGHHRKDIRDRISQYTYGFKMYSTYNSMIHPMDREIIQISNGQKLVSGCFAKLIEVGEILSADKISRNKEIKPRNDERQFTLRLYASKRLNPVFVDEPDCFKIGEINIDCGKKIGKIERVVMVQIMCCGTEFEVQAIHKDTGKQTQSTFTFLD